MSAGNSSVLNPNPIASAEIQILLDGLLTVARDNRPQDIAITEDGLTPQAAIARFRKQTGMSIAQLAGRLGMKPSKLLYAESKGKLELWRWTALSQLAAEFGLPLLSARFIRIHHQLRNPRIGRPQTR